MQRRDFFKQAGVASLALGAGAAGIGTARAAADHQWKLITSWPKNFPMLGTGANRLAELIGELSGGRIQVKVYGAGELVSAFEVFDAVARGTAEMGHSVASYWKGKSEIAQFFAGVPFGMTAQEMNGWLYHGGGLELWTELYARFGLIPFPAGNSEVQMGGWFNKEIKSTADLQGLKMRMPGLGGEVIRRAGGTPVSLPGGELFTALESGVIDATEWASPYIDLASGLHKAARYYYYPGFHEPGTTLEAMVNRAAFEALPADLQAIVRNACKAINQDLLAEQTARNPGALRTLIERHGVLLRAYPDDVIAELKRLTEEVVSESAQKDAFSRKVVASYRKFLQESKEWSRISELAYLQARDQG
ncbi:MAG: TRAP transporter substrate-binding protein [Candidatus Thiosymbion ectosymbiont of Robbea hypermnestra]|nr:TRAP transporter substrate-binding protein [Candidatus Thiosymbion ectosymbiont of Robbea hypermnestra]